jgi:hypothetical protein
MSNKIQKENEMKVEKITVKETIGSVTNEISELRKEVKSGKRDRSMLNDVLSEGRHLLNVIKLKMAYEKDNGRKPRIKMLDALQL